jgi:DNA replication protein DnaC
LREAVRFHHEFGDCGRVEHLIRIAKVLVIDDLDLADFSDTYFNWKSLVIDRASNQRPTIFTSIVTFAELGEVQPSWHEQVCRVLYEIPVAGMNRRAAEVDRTLAQLLKPRRPR